MKKIIAIILVVVMMFTLLVGCGPKPEDEKMKIGVYVSEWNQNMLMMQAYYDNYLAKEFNVEFVYSEPVNSLEGFVTFVENSATMGVKAIINWLTFAGDNNIAAAAKCEEYGIYYTYNNAATDPNLDQFEHFIGVGGAYPEVVAEQFTEMTNRVLSDGKKHNAIMHSGLCLMGVAQHNLTGEAILDVFAKKYNFKYNSPKSTYDLVTTTTAQTELDTGSDIRIILEPGQPPVPDTWANLLKDGAFDTCVFTGPFYTRVETAIADAEKVTGKNIHIISIAAITDTTRNSFASKDSTGNQSIDAALIKNTTSAGVLFALAYNALEGNAAKLRVNGKTQLYDAPMWTCYTLEEYDRIAQLDTPGSGYYSYTVNDIKACLFSENPSMTVESLKKICSDKMDLGAVLAANGLK